jgi:hypothetical protein
VLLSGSTKSAASKLLPGVTLVAASGTPSGVAGWSRSHLRVRPRVAPSGVAWSDRLRFLATRAELAGFPSVLRGQRSSERARPSWKPGAFRGVTEPAGGAPRGASTVRIDDRGPSGPRPKTLARARRRVLHHPRGGAEATRHPHSASSSEAVNISGCSSSDVVALPAPRRFRASEVVGTDQAFGLGRENAGTPLLPSGSGLLRERPPGQRFPRSRPSGRSCGLPPGTASAMSNQVASGTSPREHRANVCGNMHGSQRTLRVPKTLRSGDPQKRRYEPWQHGDGLRRTGEQRREGNDAR